MADAFNRAVNDLPTEALSAPVDAALDATIIGAESDITPPGGAAPRDDQATIVPPTGGTPVTPPRGSTLPPPPATPAPGPVTPAPSAVEAATRRGLSPVLLGVAALIVLGLIGGGAYLLFGGDDEPDATPVAGLQTEVATEEPPTDTPTPEPTNTPTPEPTATDTPTPEPTSTPRTTIATILAERVNVRRGPGFEYESLGALPRDEEALVNGVSADGDWYQIVFGPQLGWVPAESVRISGNPNILVIEWPTATPEPSNTPTPEPTATDTP